MPAIDVHDLTKSFDGFVAVDGISFTIESGEIFGLLGPNGAGKTTTIAMLATMQRPTSGAATVNGHDIVTDEDGVRRSIGIVFQDQSLDEELTAYENMDFHGRLYRIGGEVRRQRIGELLALVRLEDRKDDLVKTYSGGMRRRLEIARGLLHEPTVLFLDEPTLGLDPQTRNHLWEYIERLNAEKGITIILTTHYMEEADRLCDRVAIIDRGSIVAEGTPAGLKASIGGDVITIASPDPDAVAGLLTAPWVSGVERRDGQVTIRLENAEEHVPGIVTAIHQRSIGITSLAVRKPTLEDVFLHYTGRTIREEEASGREAMRMFHRAGRR
ncbi:ATP-binding cassette domain-containing protein [Methanoculleus sp. FWC-SCC1]|uniref:ATP-binding cassette domain-containing protein n=1 Tax=Methanoculleus frigidifontis TaxID=2584085 RepID=A0ABT8MDD0_9EURY|nr:ATP-binding cassette domain-containing protein [Methanoculleus sp. FWC-SCC1]MDN7025953.1 ATP-binding cassette domain-containing protein [Methanoculleus sp. FWC-SCC1]